MHAFTGCDTVSAFAGRGKLLALKLLRQTTKFKKAFLEFGQIWKMSDELFDSLEEFTCRLYVSQSDICKVNEIRFQIFRSKNGDVDSGQLIP